MDLYKIMIFGIIFLMIISGLGFAIISLLYTWIRLKLEEIKEGVYR